MATGGAFGPYDIAHFNGGLFADHTTHPLIVDDMAILARVSDLDWASVEPAIFGTLFERSLDPAKRAQLGAHYTSRDDILLIVDPVLMAPLRRRWDEVRARVVVPIGAVRSKALPAFLFKPTGHRPAFHS